VFHALRRARALLEVAAGAEAAAGTGHHDAAHLRVMGRLPDLRREVGEQGVVHRVQGVRPVQGDQRHPFAHLQQ